MIQYFLIPAMGGIIGYFTNDLAIRMLFRPYEAKHIFGMRVPFTPGLIAKRKSDLAIAMGRTISNRLMNPEVLQKTLLSDSIINKLRSSINKFIDKQKTSDQTLHDFLSQYLTEATVDATAHHITGNIADSIKQHLADSNIGANIAHKAVVYLKDYLKNGGGMLSLIGGIAETMTEKAESVFTEHINSLIEKEAPEMAKNMVGSQIDKLLSTKMKNLCEGHDKQLQQLTESIIAFYRRIIMGRLPGMLSTINISRMVETRINEMSVEETEKMVLDVMRRELRAIVWLGAALGAIMGCVNLFFIQ
ncbi:MAG: DUF445 family protein [Bacteroidales bacterium]|nr:DUF445 family protein [Bacteroidales bacterium]